jgi:hypothetical protein
MSDGYDRAISYDNLERYLGEDFDAEDVGQLPDDECNYCERQAATGEHGCCRWCREYLHAVAVGAGVSADA